MSFFSIANLLLGVLCGLTSMVFFHLVVFYRKVKSYPPGPTPLPFLGNLLLLTKKDNQHLHNSEIILNLSKKYGTVFTFWIGSTPNIIVCDPKLVIQGLKNKTIAGRPDFIVSELLFDGKKNSDVVFADFSSEWSLLRRVAHSAVRQYAFSHRLPEQISPIVDEVITEIKKESGWFSLEKYLYLTMFSLLASIAFGRSYSFYDEEFLHLKHLAEKQINMNSRIMLINFLPFMKYVFRKDWMDLKAVTASLKQLFDQKFKEHEETLDSNVVRDLCDALIIAKRNETNLEAAQLLDNTNLTHTIFNLFQAGTETTKVTLLWVFFFMTTHVDMMNRMREEILKATSTREVPSQAMKSQCPFTVAFIYECLRMRHLIPFGVPHKTVTEIIIGSFKIAGNTTVAFSLESALKDPKTWGDDVEEFNPNRFLDENNTVKTLPNFIPFSVGRRSCIGEKLAIENIFLITARFLQQTKDYDIEIKATSGKLDSRGDPSKTSSVSPCDYLLRLIPKK